MPVVRSYRRRQWEALGRRLDALPEKAKDDQSLKVGDGVRTIRTQISAAREKGYTLNELIEQATQEGIDVSVNSLRYAMRRAEQKGRVRQDRKEAMRSRSVAPTQNKTSVQASSGQDNALRTGSKRKEDKGTTTSGQQVQGFLGFPISPDTENL
ncbi:hypothetical protein [Paraburkholderia sp. BL10I2N1]|uniref:hypothetical protein n=1 Tax=Paraburkholderia sp. BL10I2N1 TaxID=1938796 RepID=UPI00106041BB|nr:hypothetical protein [Paraburkholderia sp. BL10I2N1]TDN69456.1 hypothetical protein B0G77_2842 [Paraburkholderia sp. BL10I2N1]